MAERDPVSDAWEIHGAIVTWTSNVDSKSSFVLAIESAVMVAVIGFTGNGRLSDLRGTACISAFWAGIVALSIGLISVAIVVRPRLRGAKASKESKDNYIYFGHVIKWGADDLADALRTRDLLPVLTRQIVWMSEVAWFKYRLLQVSMSAAMCGTALVSVAAWLNAP